MLVCIYVQIERHERDLSVSTGSGCKVTRNMSQVMLFNDLLSENDVAFQAQ